MNKPKVIAIVGPTASGKTSLSIELAKRFGGEIVSADSRQVYRGLDIGSGKVTEEEMQGIPHHLLDVAEPNETYTGADFKKAASEAIEAILKRNNVPIIAGGSFFYLDLLRDKMQAATVEPDEAYRQELESLSTEVLFEKLKILDVHRANTIDKDNRRRLIRSLEIIKVLGVVPESKPLPSPYDWLIIGLDIQKETLHQNIKRRLEERFKKGMIDEVKGLIHNGVSIQRLESFGLEYRYIAKYLNGELSEPAMKEQLEIKIRQFAKRQMTWLKRDELIQWYEPTDRLEIFNQVKDFLLKK
jgi:tRNA dimethylallyltransferase